MQSNQLSAALQMQTEWSPSNSFWICARQTGNVMQQSSGSQVRIRSSQNCNPFHALHNGITPNVRTFYCIVIFSRFLF